jgi:DnaK suppressor protein
MPKAKQQDPVEAPRAEAKPEAQANGGNRRKAAPAAPAGPAAHDKAAGDNAVADKAVAGLVPDEKPAHERAPREKAAHDKAAHDKAAHDKADKASHDDKVGHAQPESGQTPVEVPAAGGSEALGHTTVGGTTTSEANPSGGLASGVSIPETTVGETTVSETVTETATGTAKPKHVEGRPRPVRGAKASNVEGDGAGAVPDEARDRFLETQRALLLAERYNYTRQAEELRAEAEALALEHEPGDVQFDEEGGEGGTANVDRELDLHLSAQAHAAVEEIDAALLKIAAGTYGACESCGSPIPRARLEALPHARLCVSCKSGGLTARRQ